MNPLRHRIARLPIVAVAAVAWLAISNHCALAALEDPAKTPMPGCHHTAPANPSPAKDDEKGGVQCCKVLRATLLRLSKNLAAHDTTAFARFDYVVALISAADQAQLTRITEWDTGPPNASSFAESVLQRSILAHAPPFPG
ncbi:MAG: hypothetical protein M3N48_11820 [Verrucomicrobiota bacterium]|nr:hypothetical protein [Verrucomicrobiota bacterium]